MLSILEISHDVATIVRPEYMSESFMNNVSDSILSQAFKDRDQRLLKFLSGRSQVIKYNTEKSKRTIKLSDFAT